MDSNQRKSESCAECDFEERPVRTQQSTSRFDSEVDSPTPTYGAAHRDAEVVLPAGVAQSEASVDERKQSWTVVQRFRDQLAKNLTPHWPLDGFVAKTFTRAIIILLSYGAAWAILGKDILPCSLLFPFALLIVLSAAGGFIARIIYLPPLVGMILVGFLFATISKSGDNSSCGSINGTSNVTGCRKENETEWYALDDEWSATMRRVALVVILTRAGLSLNADVLKQRKFVVARLAFLPSLAEVCVEAISAHFLLDMPWDWAFMTGFLVAAISPAVVVLGLLPLRQRGYGTAQGIPTLLIAAATGDDVVDISGFSLCFALTFGEGSLVFNAFRAPLEIGLGLAWGILFGILSWWLPSSDQSCGCRNRTRQIYLLASGLFAMFGGKKAGFTGAGALGVVVTSFVASYGWETDKRAVADKFKILWQCVEPALFGLTGAAVDIGFLSADVIGLGLTTLAFGLVARMTVTYVIVSQQGFTVKEKLFIALVWIPKSGVQAAFGSVAYNTVKEDELGQDQLDLGKKLIVISFLVIVICAPLGAAAIQLSGPRLLRKTDGPTTQNIANTADPCESSGSTCTPINIIFETSI